MKAKTIALNFAALAVITALFMLFIEGVAIWTPGVRGHEMLTAFVTMGLLVAGGIWSMLTWFGVESWVATADDDNRLAAVLDKFQMRVRTTFAFGMFFTFLSVICHSAAIYGMVLAVHQLVF